VGILSLRIEEVRLIRVLRRHSGQHAPLDSRKCGSCGRTAIVVNTCRNHLITRECSTLCGDARAGKAQSIRLSVSDHSIALQQTSQATMLWTGSNVTQ